MKKSITANIGGRIFHIDEDAYETLNRYLKQLAQYFRKSQGSDEIMEDIELRISELLFDRAGKAGIVSLAQVNEVITEMGRPEDFDPEAGSPDAASEAPPAGEPSKRLFRDPDDRVLGGVCAGIGHYFGIDPVWVRLVFAAAILFFGTGFLLYIVLWIVIPEAKTAAEKLQMKGRPVNISNLEETIREEMKGMKERLQNFKEEAKNIKHSDAVHRFRSFFQDLADAIRDFFQGIGGGGVKLVGGLLVMAAMAMLAFFVIELTDIGWATGSIYPNFAGYLTGSPSTARWMGIGLLLVLLIPVLVLFIRGTMLLFGIKKRGALWGGFFIFIWILGLFLVLFSGINIARDFRYSGSQTIVHTFDSLPYNTLYLDLAHRPYKVEWDNFPVRIDANDLLVTEDTFLVRDIAIRIEETNGPGFRIVEKHFARGRSPRNARHNAAAIDYCFAKRDSLILFDPEFPLKGNTWRLQRVRITVQVPRDKHLVIGHKLDRYIESAYRQPSDSAEYYRF